MFLNQLSEEEQEKELHDRAAEQFEEYWQSDFDLNQLEVCLLRADSGHTGLLPPEIISAGCDNSECPLYGAVLKRIIKKCSDGNLVRYF